MGIKQEIRIPKRVVFAFRSYALSVFLITILSSHLALLADDFSQHEKFSIGINKLTVREAIKQIESQSRYIFFYSEATLDLDRRVSLNFSDEEITSILNELLKGTPNEYVIQGNQIVISRPYPNKASEIFQQEPQNLTYRKVRGIVVDVNREPIPGVNVVLKGTGMGGVTDMDGHFEIRVRNERNETLKFSFIGMETQDVEVGQKEALKVIMKEKELLIDDVVVVGAYGKRQNEIDMTGSAFQVDSKDIESLPAERIDLLLDGLVPGLTIAPNTDSPASTRTRYNVRIRGDASLSASNEPLWIIDGTPAYTGGKTNLITGMSVSVSPLSTINPNDIESITVLKDASETSIYGADGANGVILVTTKSGSKNLKKVNFSAQTGMAKINASTRFKVLNANQYLTLAKESYGNAGLDMTYFPFLDNDINDYSSTATDWYDVYYGMGRTDEGNLSFSGGTDYSTYYISGGYFHKESTVKGNTQNRYSLRVKNSIELSSKLSANIIAYASYNVNDIFNPSTDYYENLPIYSNYNEDGTFRLYNKFIDGKNSDGSPIYKLNKFFNSVAEREENDHQQHSFSSNSNLSINYAVSRGLNLTAQMGIDYISGYEDIYYARTNWSGMNTDGEPEGSSTRNHSNVLTWNNVEHLNFDRNYGKHNISGMLGFEMKSQERRSVSSWGYGFINDHIKEVSYAQEQDGSSSSDIDHSMSFFSKAGYSYAQKYYVSFNYRKDGNSDFGEDVRWGNFASAAGSWNIHNESFFKSKIINILKLKGSFGSNGNSRLGSQQSDGVYSYRSSDYYINKAGGSMVNAPNPLLSWETTYMANVGLRMKLINRFDINAEWYNNKTVDLLSHVDVSHTTGGDTQITRNVGKMQNRGIEITLTSKNISTPVFEWTTQINLSHNQNKLLELYNGIQKTSGTKFWKAGYSINTYYLVRWAGVDPQDGMPMWYDADDNITKTYSYDNRVPYKESNPDLTGGVVNSIVYKNFDFRIILNYVIGGYGFSSFSRNVSSDGLNIMSSNQSVNQLDRWQKPGDLALSPKPLWGISTKSVMNSSRYLYDKTHVKLQNVSLGYNLPDRLINKLDISNCRISLIADNIGLWTLHDQKNRNSYRQSMSGYPMESTCSLNLNVSF